MIPVNTELTVDTFNSKLGIALNVSQRTYDAKDSRNFLIEFKPEIAKVVESLSENQFHNYITLGFVCKFLIDNNLEQNFHKETGEWIDKTIEELLSLKKEKRVENDSTEKKHDIQKAILSQIREKIGEIDNFFDDYVYGKENNLDVIEYIKQCNFSPLHIRKIYNIYQKEKEEYLNIDSDPELQEAYAFIRKGRVKKIVEFYDSVLEKMDNFIKLNSTRRKRTTKKPSIQKMVSKVNYLSESKEFGIISLLPDKIVGASMAILFNEKTKKLSIFNALDRGGLQIKGTTILNFDEKTSMMKTVRSYVNMQELAQKPKTGILKAFKELTTKESPCNGRINSDTIILKIF